MAYWGLLAIWLLLAATTVGSITSQGWTKAAKVQWILAVLLIPIVAAGFYCLVCLYKGDYSGFRFMGFKKRSL